MVKKAGGDKNRGHDDEYSHAAASSRDQPGKNRQHAGAAGLAPWINDADGVRIIVFDQQE